MSLPDNIVVGEPLVSLESLGISKKENTVFESEIFLPRLLVKHGFFKSTSEVKRANVKKGHLPLWRRLEQPEFTYVEIGHKKFWLVVGESENNA
jgi:hypothetical protein